MKDKSIVTGDWRWETFRGVMEMIYILIEVALQPYALVKIYRNVHKKGLILQYVNYSINLT